VRLFERASLVRLAGYRTDDLRLREPPALAFFCPGCAELEFGDGADSQDRRS
jgi:hypothetical protein